LGDIYERKKSRYGVGDVFMTKNSVDLENLRERIAKLENEIAERTAYMEMLGKQNERLEKEKKELEAHIYKKNGHIAALKSYNEDIANDNGYAAEQRLISSLTGQVKKELDDIENSFGNFTTGLFERSTHQPVRIFHGLYSMTADDWYYYKDGILKLLNDSKGGESPYGTKGLAKEDKRYMPCCNGTPKPSRFEVIDEDGRKYVRYDCEIEQKIQDNGKTLKVFVKAVKPQGAVE
jgi:hypothetical protein